MRVATASSRPRLPNAQNASSAVPAERALSEATCSVHTSHVKCIVTRFPSSCVSICGGCQQQQSGSRAPWPNEVGIWRVEDQGLEPLRGGARDRLLRGQVSAPDSSVAAVPPKKQPMLPTLARTVMSDSRPATELLYARMMPAHRRSPLEPNTASKLCNAARPLYSRYKPQTD